MSTAENGGDDEDDLDDENLDQVRSDQGPVVERKADVDTNIE
jgi:hypothetical protein